MSIDGSLTPRQLLIAGSLGEISAPDASPAPLAATVEEAVGHLFTQAEAALPGIDLPLRTFADFLRRLLPGGLRHPADLLGLCATDLYLVCACCRGSDVAVRTLEVTYRPTIYAVLSRMGVPQAQAQDIWQLILQRLLQGVLSGGGAYTGRGSLRRWLHVSAVREGIRSGRRSARQIPLQDSALIERVEAQDAPDLSIMKRRYRDAFRAAFLEALGALPVRQRNLLRHYYLDRLGVTELGRLHGVNPATAWRWLERCRQDLFINTREALRRQLPVSDPDFDSIARLMPSQLNLSLRTLLGEGA